MSATFFFIKSSSVLLQFHSPMASTHFILFPFMAQGHMIPMIDLAKLLAHQGAIITIVTTRNNSARYDSVLARAIDSGLQIRLHLFQFPSKQVGLPESCDNFDLLPSHDPSFSAAFHRAAKLLYEPSEQLFQQLTPPPSCIISDMFLPWTLNLARKHNIPRLVFYSWSCFFLRCMKSLLNHQPGSSPVSETYVTLSDLPGSVELRKSQLPKSGSDEIDKLGYEMWEADRDSYGVIFNGFEDMETEYVAEYKKDRNSPEKVWCVGPVSLHNNDELDKAERGGKSSINKHECIKWLDEQTPSSVVYISMGSQCNLAPTKLIELGLGIEASQKPFIWAIRKGNLTEELNKWMEEYEYEKRIENRGRVIRGWAPQILILSHCAIGSFMMHCGWNSTMEGVSAGVAMITWPLAADQAFNEKLIVEILGIGVSAGEEKGLNWGGEEMVVDREKVREAIEMAMDDGDGRDEMRKRCKKLAEMAKRAVQEGGSSHRNIKLLIQEIVKNGEEQNNGSCINPIPDCTVS